METSTTNTPKRRNLTHMEAHKVIGWLKKNRSVYLTQEIEVSVASARAEIGIEHLSRWSLGELARELGMQKQASPGSGRNSAMRARLDRIERNLSFIAKELGVTLPEEMP